MNKATSIILSVLLLAVALFATPAGAALSGLGPVVETGGYPWYYEDNRGLQLTLCPGGDPMCISVPVIVGDPASEALGVGDESFFWSADALAPPLTANGKAILVLSLEGAFGGVGGVEDGQQIVFGRTRIRIDVPQAGNYRVIFPFGQVDFPNVTVAGGINYTEDLGTINPLFPELAFNGALDALVGPFLTWDSFDPDPALNDPQLQRPVDPLDPLSPVNQYVGDPAIAHAVTGGTNGNSFIIQRQVDGSGNYVTLSETDLFTVTGLVLAADAVQPALHVFPAAPAQNLYAVGPVNRSGNVGTATPQQPEGIRLGSEVPGYPVGFPVYYQEAIPAVDPVTGDPVLDPVSGLQVVDPGIQLTICPAVDIMCISAPIDPANPASVALGTGDEAFFSSADAFINDRTVDVADAQGLDGLLVISMEGAFGGLGVAADGQQIAFARVRIRIDTPLAGTYTVTYPYGVEVFENVPAGIKAINITKDIGIIDPADPDNGFAGALYGLIGPRFLTWDTFSADPALNDPLLQKPSDINDPLAPLIHYIGDPAVDHLVVGSTLADGNDPSGFQNYFRIQGPSGIDVTTHLFNVSGKVYDPATFQVIPDPAAPVAIDDAAATEGTTPVVIDVLANDSLDGAPINPVDATIAIQPAGALFGPNNGSVAVNANNTVTYTPTAGITGTDTFGYTVSVNGVASNTATVTVNVTPVEVIAVTRAQFDQRKLEWNLQGTDPLDGVTLTIHAGANLGGPVIGSVLVNGGRWKLRTRATSNPGVNTISIQSSTGKILLNQPVQVR